MRLNDPQANGSGQLSVSARQAFPRDLTPHEHLLQVYDQDETLIQSVATFLADGLSAGESVIVVATPEHRLAFERELQASGLDPAAAAANGRFFSFDAAATLERFMVDGIPDPQRFFDSIGSVMAKARASGTAVRAFGEMVAILWAQGNRIGALRLEDLWNELSRSSVFRLLCAYPARHFTGANSSLAWIDVCKCHTRVIL